MNVAGKVSREYVYFGRTGELLYLMLCRSSRRQELETAVSRLLTGDNPWNKLLGMFQPAECDDLEMRANSFLPYSSHPVFDLLAEDWLHVLSLDLPGFDALPHLVTLGAFHVMLYQLRVSGGMLDRPLHFICEVVAPRKTIVRELSALNFQENNLLPQRAIESYLTNLTQSDRWKAAQSQPSAFAACKAILEEEVRWPNDPDDYDGCSDPEALVAELRRAALSSPRDLRKNGFGKCGMVNPPNRKHLLIPFARQEGSQVPAWLQPSGDRS